MEIGTQIKQLRTQRGITQETLAEQLSVSPQAVSKWERGAATPDIQLLPAISAFFGVSIDELFALSDETRMERIQNMLWDERVLNPDTVARERAFLLERVGGSRRTVRCIVCWRISCLTSMPVKLRILRWNPFVVSLTMTERMLPMWPPEKVTAVRGTTPTTTS